MTKTGSSDIEIEVDTHIYVYEHALHMCARTEKSGVDVLNHFRLIVLVMFIYLGELIHTHTSHGTCGSSKTTCSSFFHHMDPRD